MLLVSYWHYKYQGLTPARPERNYSGTKYDASAVKLQKTLRPQFCSFYDAKKVRNIYDVKKVRNI